MSPHRIDVVTLSDDALIASIRAGDERVFEAWYLAFFEPLWRFASQFAPSATVAKDVVQDVFLSIWLHRDSFAVQTSVTAYLYGAVRHRALRYTRHEGVVRHSEILAETTGVRWGMGEALPSPDDQIDAANQRALVDQAIRKLPERQRQALSLWLVQELGTTEIAEILGISDRAVRKLLEKARSHVVEVLRAAGLS